MPLCLNQNTYSNTLPVSSRMILMIPVLLRNVQGAYKVGPQHQRLAKECKVSLSAVSLSLTSSDIYAKKQFNKQDLNALWDCTYSFSSWRIQQVSVFCQWEKGLAATRNAKSELKWWMELSVKVKDTDEAIVGSNSVSCCSHYDHRLWKTPDPGWGTKAGWLPECNLRSIEPAIDSTNSCPLLKAWGTGHPYLA